MPELSEEPWKTVLTDAAREIDIEVPRDRAGTFEPVIVAKRGDLGPRARF